LLRADQSYILKRNPFPAPLRSLFHFLVAGQQVVIFKAYNAFDPEQVLVYKPL
jgi:hypothetical protein